MEGGYPSRKERIRRGGVPGGISRINPHFLF